MRMRIGCGIERASLAAESFVMTAALLLGVAYSIKDSNITGTTGTTTVDKPDDGFDEMTSIKGVLMLVIV